MSTLTKSEAVEILIRLENLGVSYSGIAAACEVSPGTIHRVLTTGELPRRSESARKITRFAERNRGARTRAEISFV